MLEHAHRYDPVERSAHVAVVAQLEVHPARHALRLGAALRHRMLLPAQGDAGHRQPRRHVGEAQAQAAPATADVQQPPALGQVELGGDVRLLGRLGLLQSDVRRGEVGAGILHVRIQEAGVQLVRQVVVVRHVAPRRAAIVHLLQPPAHRLLYPTGRGAGLLPETRVVGDQLQQVEHVALLEHQLPVHEALPELQLRVQGQLHRRPGLHADDDGRAVSVAVAPGAPLAHSHREVADIHRPLKITLEHADASRPSTPSLIMAKRAKGRQRLSRPVS